MRCSLRPCVRRRPTTYRLAVLHELRFAEVRQARLNGSECRRDVSVAGWLQGYRGAVVAAICPPSALRRWRSSRGRLPQTPLSPPPASHRLLLLERRLDAERVCPFGRPSVLPACGRGSWAW